MATIQASKYKQTSKKDHPTSSQNLLRLIINDNMDDFQIVDWDIQSQEFEQCVCAVFVKMPDTWKLENYTVRL